MLNIEKIIILSNHLHHCARDRFQTGTVNITTFNLNSAVCTSFCVTDKKNTVAIPFHTGHSPPCLPG